MYNFNSILLGILLNTVLRNVTLKYFWMKPDIIYNIWNNNDNTVSTPDTSGNTIEDIIISCCRLHWMKMKLKTVNWCLVLFMTYWHKVQTIFNRFVDALAGAKQLVCQKQTNKKIK